MSGQIAHVGILLGGYAGASFQYWNPADKSSFAVLSSNDKIVGGSASNTSKWVRSIVSKTSGKWRIQLVDQTHVELAIGFSLAGSVGGFLGGTSAGWGLWGTYGGTLRLYNNNTFTPITGVLATGDVVDVLVDIDAGKAWWRINGTVVSGDPVAGTGEMASFTPGSTIYAAADPYGADGAIRLRANPGEMTGSAVSGFTDGWPT